MEANNNDPIEDILDGARAFSENIDKTMATASVDATNTISIKEN